MKFSLKNLFKRDNKNLKGDNSKTYNTEEIQDVVRGVFSVDGELIAGAYYFDEEIKAIASDIGCVKLDKEPKLIESINIKTPKIENLLLKLKCHKVEDFIFTKELC